MQTISIQNFRPIQNVENLEVKKMMILIGEQASGKSTISKLIYFFKSLKEEFMLFLNELAIKKDEFVNITYDTIKHFRIKIGNKFISFFGDTTSEEFKIIYKYNFKFNICFNAPNTGNAPNLIVEFSNDFDSFFYEFIKNWKDLLNKYEEFNKKSFPNILSRQLERKKLDILTKEFENQINELFGESESIESYYIPAGRSLLSSFKQSYQSRVSGELAEKSHFDAFVLRFFKKIDEVKNDILFDRKLSALIDDFSTLKEKKFSNAQVFHEKMRHVLQADYEVDSFGEKLVSPKFGKPIRLDFASSGQQEIVWILLQLLVFILENKPVFVVIEEPEAHLYPTAQIEIMNLIAIFLNAHPQNQAIITTHSPYMLTAANNLLFAQKIYEKSDQSEAAKQQIAETLGTADWIKPENLGAFYLSQQNGLVNIFNPETGLISQNELDNASENIMSVFDDLLDIYKNLKKSV
jgi:predicted ATPase